LIIRTSHIDRLREAQVVTAFIDVKAMFDPARLRAAGIGAWRL
jgi:hypothetical protein